MNQFKTKTYKKGKYIYINAFIHLIYRLCQGLLDVSEGQQWMTGTFPDLYDNLKSNRKKDTKAGNYKITW